MNPSLIRETCKLPFLFSLIFTNHSKFQIVPSSSSVFQINFHSTFNCFDFVPNLSSVSNSMYLIFSLISINHNKSQIVPSSSSFFSVNFHLSNLFHYYLELIPNCFVLSTLELQRILTRTQCVFGLF